MSDQKRVERAREVFAFCEFDRKPECDWIDHSPTWCGDCYACADCGLIFQSVTAADRAVKAERKRIAAKLQGLFNSLDSYDQWDGAIQTFIEELEAEK